MGVAATLPELSDGLQLPPLIALKFNRVTIFYHRWTKIEEFQLKTRFDNEFRIRKQKPLTLTSYDPCFEINQKTVEREYDALKSKF